MFNKGRYIRFAIMNEEIISKVCKQNTFMQVVCKIGRKVFYLKNVLELKIIYEFL